MHPNRWDRGLQVTADGNGLVGHGGAILLRKLADRSGLTAELDAALARTGTSPQVSQGMALVSTSIAIAMGATAMADMQQKQEAIEKTAPPGSKQARYKPPDPLLEFLENL